MKAANVTILIKDGYNGIEVTADYQGQTVTQVYSLKGKVTRYVQENISAPVRPRTGDTAGYLDHRAALPISTRSSVFITLPPRRCSIRICLCRA